MRVAVLAAWLIALGGVVAWADESADDSNKAAEAVTTVPYQASIEGIEGADFADTLRESSLLLSKQDDPPETIAALRQRARTDLDRFRQVLRSYGYYSGTIRGRIDDQASPVQVTLTVDAGPQYRLETWDAVDAQGAPITIAPPVTPEGVGLKPGAPALAKDIVNAQSTLMTQLPERGHPLAKYITREAFVDTADHTMAVYEVVAPGPLARFGDTEITGLTHLHPEFVRRRIAWARGAQYSPDPVNETRNRLLKNQAVGAVVIDHAEAVGADGDLPMTVTVTEAKRYAIGAGAGYDTSRGVDANFTFEDRDLFGYGELGRIRLQAGQELAGAFLTYEEPDFLEFDQKFTIDGRAFWETSDAYERWVAALIGQIERDFFWGFRTRVGLALQSAKVDPKGEYVESQDYIQVGVPWTVFRDSRNDVLNPTSGHNLQLQLSPFQIVSNPMASYLVAGVSDTAYFPIDEEERYVIAARGEVTSIMGADRDTIPVDQRLYAGGGGTIRGYAYQGVGPLNPDYKPIGGLSRLVMNLEFRARVFEDIGIVPFIDGGQVWEESTPQFTDLKFGAGLGLRYYSPIGPIRVDVAVPLDRNPRVDQVVQFYVAIGQNF